MEKNLQVSPITLGTVQLGVRYGIANQVGQPEIGKSKGILSKALACGVNTWDTARDYGIAEEVIGAFIQSNLGGTAPLVMSKFNWNDKAFISSKNALDQAREQVGASLTRLGIAQLPILLLHQHKDHPIQDIMWRLPAVLRVLQEDGLIARGGISLYYAEDARYVVDEPVIQAIHAPLNVLDQRLIVCGALQDLYRERKTVFIHSVFLQGLFFMEEQQLPASLNGIVPYLRQLRGLAKEADMSMAQFAFSYVRDTVGVSSVIFGVETAQQVEQNASLLQGSAISEAIRAKVSTLFRDLPDRLITTGYR